MSRYSALSHAIELFEAITKIDFEDDRKALQDIAKDVRYGGQGKGDYEELARSLDTCTKMECFACKFKSDSGCKAALKRDAAAAIRQLSKSLKESREAHDRALETIAIQQTRLEELETTDPAEWRKEVIEAADKLPF